MGHRSQQGFAIRRERTSRLQRLTPVGELDVATAPTLQGAFDTACREAGAQATVVVDLTELDFMDSSGIAALVWMTRRLPDRLRIVNGSPAVQRVLDLTGMRPALPLIGRDDDPLAPLPGH